MNASTSLDYINAIAGQLEVDTKYDAQLLLRQCIAVPIALFNDPAVFGTYPSENRDKTGYLATSLTVYSSLFFALN